MNIQPFEQLVKAFCRMPGVGRRSAERIAVAAIRCQDVLLDPLLDALHNAKENVDVCSLCGSITTKDANPCDFCTNPSRDHSRICIVETPDDIIPIEKSGGFNGLYHSLNGKISPLKGSRPEDIRIAELFTRISESNITEVILALGTDVESDATAAYIAEKLSEKNISVSRIAFGLPADSAIGYSDPITLSRAIAGRQKI